MKSNQKSGVQTILVEKNLVKTSPSPVAYVARGPLKCQKITSRVQNCTILTEHNGLAAYLSYLAWIFPEALKVGMHHLKWACSPAKVGGDVSFYFAGIMNHGFYGSMGDWF